MFIPNYNITNKLLSNIKRINSLIFDLNNKRFPKVVLVELERAAREVSSYASTSIEGNPLPLTKVKRILKSTPAYIRDTEKEVINYNKALQDLNDKLVLGKPSLSLDFILTIHREVMDGLLANFEIGTLRQNPVVVNDPIKSQVVYLPPDEQDIQHLINDLINFINDNKEKVDSLILAGIFHKQFVLIHPFMDGNGRTTRLVTKFLLAEMGLDTFNLFSFENYYNKNVTKYFQTVGEFGNYYELQDKIDFTNWLEYFTEGIIDELLRVQKNLPQLNTSPNSQLQDYHKKILEFIQENGFIKDSDYARLTKRARPTRALDFQKLISMNLIEMKGKGRATYYILKDK